MFLFLSLPISEVGILKAFHLKFILTIEDWPVFGAIWEGHQLSAEVETLLFYRQFELRSCFWGYFNVSASQKGR